MTETVNSIFYFLSAGAAIASVFAICRANKTAKAVKNIQKNIILNHREIELIGKALEKLNIYNVWCKQDASGQDINYHDSDETEYETRDDAEMKIPRDVKFILIKLCAHSEELATLIKKWEDGFITKVGDSYCFDDSLVSKKIGCLRVIRCSLLE